MLLFKLSFRATINSISSYKFRKYEPSVVTSTLIHTKEQFSIRRIHSDRNKSNNNKKDDQYNDDENTSNESNSFWNEFKKYKWSVGGLVSFVAPIVLYYSNLKEVQKDVVNSVEKLSFGIKNAVIVKSRSPHFTHRPAIEQKINDALTYNSLIADSYTIVYGPKGVGKTELVDHAAIGKKGVVKVTVSTANTRDEIIQAMSKKLLGKTPQSDLDIDLFIQAVEKSGIIPTIIFDVERNIGVYPSVSGDHVVDTVRGLSKQLAPYCRCIIVLSEANAVLQFGKDKREEFIYIDEMEREEAKELLIKLNAKLTESEMDYVFTNIGTSPIDLINLAVRVSSTYSVQDYVTDVLRDAETSLAAFPHKLILKVLKDHPEGVAPKFFNNQKDEGVDLSYPAGVGIAMKNINAIVYRIELGKYMLMSTAHRTALQSYEPIVTKT